MKATNNSAFDININEFPAGMSKLIADSLDEKDFTKKLKARKSLVGMGRKVIPHMEKLLTSKKTLLRKEAAKIVELIGYYKSIPLMIDLLHDPEFDIRWIAAEGLIKIGRRSIVPLLKSIRDGGSSYFLNMGAHHVLNGLLVGSEKQQLETLMQSLDNFHELGETAPVEAAHALKAVFKYRN